MRSWLITVLVLGFFAVPVHGEDGPFHTVQEVFACLADSDTERMRSLVTPDFELLEVGELWDLDITLEVMSTLPPGVHRRNYFDVITSEIRGDTAWVSYWNRATFNSEEGEGMREWLESAVLVQTGGRWKLRVLHSTRLTEGQMPESVMLKEYVEAD